MKTVWVNRYNADGTFKPMSEWVIARVRSATTHVMIEDGRVFQGTRSDTFTSNGRSGIHEYIGNQRGDGWFYVADGDLPPDDEAVLISDGVDCLYTEISTLTNHNALCWRPIQLPTKFNQVELI